MKGDYIRLIANAYSRITPINCNDPTGHMSSADDGKGADREGILYLYAMEILDELGRKADLEALAQIVDKAYGLYGTYDQMIPEIVGVFLGKNESNSNALINAAIDNSGCAGVGRGAWLGRLLYTGNIMPADVCNYIRQTLSPNSAEDKLWANSCYVD